VAARRRVPVHPNCCGGALLLAALAHRELAARSRFGKRPGLLLQAAVFSLVPIVPVANAWVFAAKVAAPALIANVIGVAIFWRGRRLAGSERDTDFHSGTLDTAR
jgi:hypothetical protein